MSDLAHFFKTSHTAMGVFYPLHYLVAVFRDTGAASRARVDLLNAGFGSDDVLATEGQALIDLASDEVSLGSLLMQDFSRQTGGEQISTDHNLELSREGSALLFVYCPSELLKDKAWAVVQRAQPITAHHYGRMIIDHLAGGFDTN